LARARNAGYLYILDEDTTKNGKYDHVVPWWSNIVQAARSYNYGPTGLNDCQLLWAAYKGAMKKNHLHAWPTFEQRWDAKHWRGTVYLPNTKVPGVTIQPMSVKASVLKHHTQSGTPPPLYDVSMVWAAVHDWARNTMGFVTAMPIFDLGSLSAPNYTPDPYQVVTFQNDPNSNVLQDLPFRVVDTYEQPTFAEAGAVVRDVNRLANQQGNWALPTFTPRPDLSNDPTGRGSNYNCIFFKKLSLGEAWEDVDAEDYYKVLPK
jgi:hypothetical protein